MQFLKNFEFLKFPVGGGVTVTLISKISNPCPLWVCPLHPFQDAPACPQRVLNPTPPHVREPLRGFI